MSPHPQFPADLVTFTEEILNGKLFSAAILEGTDQQSSVSVMLGASAKFLHLHT